MGGAIGDAWGSAWGSAWEFDNLKDDKTTWYWGKRPEPDRSWKLTDDTQLTLATCEILGMHRKIEPLYWRLIFYYIINREDYNLTRIHLDAKYHQICLNFVTSPHGK